jgi:5'(3')-deoxyribonucleotidase
VRVRIITHRLYLPFFHRDAVGQTIDWLDFYGIPYWDLCFMKDKEQVGADIYVDDSPDNIVKLRSMGVYTICFANSTNTDMGPPFAGSWEEVYRLVHARGEELKRAK